MALTDTLRVTHTQTFNGQPLVCMDNFPGEGVELTPIQLRQLAAALIDIAADCEGLHSQVRKYGSVVRRQYPVGA